MKVSIVSFSYPRGVPDDPDDDYWGGFVFDCRLLPDPHDDMSLRGYSGLDKPVRGIRRWWAISSMRLRRLCASR